MRGLHLKAFTLVAFILAAAALPAFSQTQVIFPNTTTWKFYTNSVDYKTDPGFGTTWKDLGFVDTDWPSGTGLFGNETQYPYPIATPIPGPSANANTGPTVIYFRTHFNWAGSPNGVLAFGTNYIDDGNVVYLNGVEITRFNMITAGEPAWTDVAPVANPGGFPNLNAGEPVLVRMDMDFDALTNGNANPLVMGDNLLAVAVHNNAGTSSDTAFALSLFLSQQVCPTTDGVQPANRTVVENDSTTFIVNGSGVPTPTYQWYRNVGAGDEAIVGATTTSYTIANVAAADAGQYFVRLQNTCATPVDSRRSVLTYQADTTPPTFVYAQCGTAAEDIVIGLSEPLILDNGVGNTVTDEFTWLIERVTGPGIDPGQPADVVYTPGTTTILMTAQAGTLDPLATYRVVLLFDMLDRAATPNKLPANTAVPIECPLTISVLPAGAGPFTFDRPPFTKQFSTFVWAGAANGVGDTLATFEPKVQLLDATLINMPIAPVAGTPPAAANISQYASVGQYLITRPTGTEGNVILANLRNDSGATRTALTLSYNLTVEATVVEEILGHYVYYSQTGAPNSWQQLASVSGDRTTGLKTGTLDLSATPWTVGSPLYILWADDNGSGSPDDSLEIDNITVSHVATGPTLTISYSSPNITITWAPANGILQSKDDILGAWTDVTPQPAAGGPYTVAASAAKRFYSLRQ